MKKTLFLLSPLLFLLACDINTSTENKMPINLDSIKIGRETKPVLKEYQGLYNIRNFTFKSCENDSIYSIKDKTGGIDSAIAKIDYLGTVFMSMKGYETRTPKENSISVTELIKVEQKSYKNTCIQYDYWCFGTEPFWQIQISKKENLIDFYDPMEQKITHFVYSKPEIKNGITYYTTLDKENKITISIKKEKCNGAIDKQYNYSAEVLLNNKKYNGCVIKYGEE